MTDGNNPINLFNTASGLIGGKNDIDEDDFDEEEEEE